MAPETYHCDGDQIYLVGGKCICTRFTAGNDERRLFGNVQRSRRLHRLLDHLYARVATASFWEEFEHVKYNLTRTGPDIVYDVAFSIVITQHVVV